jgi:Holliday junction DNA helicase RuvA
MYEYIKGVFTGMNKDCIVVENNGIGYKIYTSGSTIAQIPQLNEEVSLFIQQIVREDFIGLYGFLTKDELNMFNLLLTINGVGAKAALSLLSICSVINLKYAIISKDEKTLVRAPGIGKKIAQRINLELMDKIDIDKNISLNNESGNEGTRIASNEALDALLSLGYTEKEASGAIKAVSGNDSVENVIKNCLKYLMG